MMIPTTIGLELELVRSTVVRRSDIVAGLPLEAKPELSIPPGGVELISAPYYYYGGLKNDVAYLFQAIRKHKLKVAPFQPNGFHVHVGTDFELEDAGSATRALPDEWFALGYTLLRTDPRRIHWCMPGDSGCGRYWAINVAAIPLHKTIEFRWANSTTSPLEMELAVHLAVAYHKLLGDNLEGALPPFTNWYEAILTRINNKPLVAWMLKKRWNKRRFERALKFVRAHRDEELDHPTWVQIHAECLYNIYSAWRSFDEGLDVRPIPIFDYLKFAKLPRRTEMRDEIPI